MPKKEYIKEMFDTISADYDHLNHLMSLNVDKSWRRRALKHIVPKDGQISVMDLACGTGDFSIAIARRIKENEIKGHITGVDLSEGMLEVMRAKIADEKLENMVSAELGDGEQLHFATASFDCVTIAFGIRNFENRETGLREMLRVLKPGGRLVVITYHSLEDRMVKNFIKTGNVEGVAEQDIYGRISTPLEAVNRKPILPEESEIAGNTRARSAKLRIAERRAGK